MRVFYLLLVALCAAASPALAADLSLQPQVPVIATSWTGFYIGANGGIVTQTTTVQDLNNWTDNSPFDSRSRNLGGTAGVQAGYNVQDGEFVYGIEADWSWTGTKGNKLLTDSCTCGQPVITQIHTEMDWVATVRGRVGLTVGRTLAYVTGGTAFASFNNHWGAGFPDPVAECGGPPACGGTNNNNFVSRSVQPGWTAGFGIEHMFAAYPHLTFKAEALWLDFANNNVTNVGPSFVSGSPGPFTSQFQNQAALGRVGLNYKF